MRRLPALLVLCAAGCSGFAPPTPEQMGSLTLPERMPSVGVSVVRSRVRMNIDSKWLSGVFEGVILGRLEGGVPAVRAQFLGDLGPKALDLAATPERIVGYFPQVQEGIDCALPSEAAPHPILFMGVSLLERLVPVTKSRVMGVREDEEGTWVKLRPAVEGVESTAIVSGGRNPPHRRYRWMYGLAWDERGSGDEVTITAPELSIQVKILGEEPLDPGAAPGLRLTLPADVRVTAGSRK